MLWTAFTLTGMKVSLLLKRRILVMDETLIFLRSLGAEIHFARSDIRKILYDLSSGESLKSLSFLEGFADYSENTDFPLVWHDCISSFSLYKSDEKSKMLQLGSFLGTTDADSQIKTIKLHESFFENYREKAITDNDKYGKAASLIGLFLGASVFILLI